MNSKKSKKIRKLLDKTYKEKYPQEIIDSIYKQIKKNYSKLSKYEKETIIKDSEFFISLMDKGV